MKKHKDKSDIISVYCDGGCRGNGRKKNIGGYGVLLEYKGHTKTLKGAVVNTTNNRMELTSCIIGLRAIKNQTLPTIVYTDSLYVIRGMNEWIESWHERYWQDVNNVDLWQELYALSQEFADLQFKKVLGHSTNTGNNKADALANQAMDNALANQAMDKLKRSNYGKK